MTRRKYSITIISNVPSKLVERVSLMHATSIFRSKSVGTTDSSSSIGKATNSCISRECLEMIQSSTRTHEKIED
jgi:hypothetical protein